MGAIRNTRACGNRFAHMSGRGAQAVLVEHVCTLVPGHDRAHTDGDRRWTDPVSTVERCSGCGWNLSDLGPPLGTDKIPDLGGLCVDCYLDAHPEIEEQMRAVPVHLHKPAGGTYCGAQVLDRKRETTAYRSEATCTDCIGSLR